MCLPIDKNMYIVRGEWMNLHFVIIRNYKNNVVALLKSEEILSLKYEKSMACKLKKFRKAKKYKMIILYYAWKNDLIWNIRFLLFRHIIEKGKLRKWTKVEKIVVNLACKYSKFKQIIFTNTCKTKMEVLHE